MSRPGFWWLDHIMSRPGFWRLDHDMSWPGFWWLDHDMSWPGFWRLVYRLNHFFYLHHLATICRVVISRRCPHRLLLPPCIWRQSGTNMLKNDWDSTPAHDIRITSPEQNDVSFWYLIHELKVSHTSVDNTTIQLALCALCGFKKIPLQSMWIRVYFLSILIINNSNFAISLLPWEFLLV